jgi:biotin-dependent carboxylase-like uncharacterized protein
MIEIVRAGIATTFQDLGRPGHAHIGVGSAGAVDPSLAALVNRLVGNGPGAAVIETSGDLEITAVATVRLASTEHLSAVTLPQGGSLTVRAGAHGRLWQYVAIGGGFDVPPTLGSRSYDTMSGLGPPPPRVGDRFTGGQAFGDHAVVDHAPLRELSSSARVLDGPRRDWFSPVSWEALTSARWTVTTTSRIGVRLRGATIERVVQDELPSEGLVRGAIQAPPGGELVMMLADHPTTGGYPVIAVVHPDDVAIVAQHSAGTSVRFRNYG